MTTTLIVAIDLGVLKAYRLEKSRLNSDRLVLLTEISAADAHDKIVDKVTDQAGRYRVPGSNMAMSYGERQKIALELRKRLVRQLAAQLDRLLLNEEVDNCYLAASKEINHPLVNELSARSQAKIVKNISADLTKVDKRELLEHFSE